jgi:hypothetical protein
MRVFLLMVAITLTASCAQIKHTSISEKDIWLSGVSEKDIGLSKSLFFKKYSSGVTLQRVLVEKKAGIEVYTNVSTTGGNRIFIIFEDVDEFNKCPFSSSGKCRYSYAELNEKPIYTTDWAGTGKMAGFFSESDLSTGSSLISRVLFDKIKVYDEKKIAMIRGNMRSYGLSYNAAYSKWIANGQSLDDINLTGVKTNEISHNSGYLIDLETLNKLSSQVANVTPKYNPKDEHVTPKYNQKYEHVTQKSYESNPKESLAGKLISAVIDIYKLKEETKINNKNLREVQKAARIGTKSAIKKANLMKQAQKPMY